MCSMRGCNKVRGSVSVECVNAVWESSERLLLIIRLVRISIADWSENLSNFNIDVKIEGEALIYFDC